MSFEIKMFQTADDKNYAEMIEIAAPCNRAYCERHGIVFESFVGIKRGFFPWHACFNRIVYLKEQIEAGYRGWVFYIDADAFVYDHDFDVREIIKDQEGDFYFSPGGLTGKAWDVNDGVFLINLGSETGRALALAWHKHFMGTTEAQLREAEEWQMVPSDQPRLHELLRKNAEFTDRLVHVPRELLNDEKASFVRQVLRTNAGSMDERLAKLKRGVAEAMSDKETDQSASSGESSFLQNPEQYGAAYDTEFRRILSQYAAEASSFLEWGAGYTTRMMIEHIGTNDAEILLTIDDNEEYLRKVVSDFSDLSYLQPKAMSMTGPCVDDRDTGLNYSTYPLSLGRKFDFIFIDGRRRMECAMMALLLAHSGTVIVVHDYRRNRYQPVHALFQIIESGPQFRVMRARPTLLPSIEERLDAVWAGIMAPPVGNNQPNLAQSQNDAAKPLSQSISNMGSSDALALAHKLTQENRLNDAIAMAQLALREPKELGNSATNARLLLASLLERQGDLVEAAKVVAKACEEDPGHTNAQADRTRIVDALRAKANAIPTDQKAEKAAMFAQVISTGGWSFADAKNLFFASSGLMRG